MKKPIVAIVGRPNVGKSTLFNALSGGKISIVDDRPGVTRDRIYADADWQGRSFTLIDTGGIEPESDDIILRQMREQAELAVSTADVIIFMLDARAGITDADFQVAQMLRKSRKPVILCINKMDSLKKQSNDIYEFYELGMGDPIAVSASGKLGLGELLDETVKYFNPVSADEEEDERPKIAVIGHPNVGKSSIINRLMGSNRLIVSDIAGTTRDAVDTVVVHDGREYVFIDTAGLRRKARIKDDIERYSIIRSVAAVERCDIAVIVIDATEGVTEQDVRIAGIAHERNRGAIIAVNKWDALPDKNDKSIYKFTEELRQKFSYMQYAEIMFVSALTGKRLFGIFDEIDKVRQAQLLRIQSGVLNEIITEATAMHEPPQDKGKRLRIFYATQTGTNPPTFVLFVNHRELFHFSYLRYIENRIREAFVFTGTPLKFVIRERKQKDE